MTLSRFDFSKIIIFGGTGTIGSICTDVLNDNMNFQDIYLVTNNEHEIWEAKNKWKNNNNIHIIFGDIRDREEIRKLFIDIKPTVIINCAALKHVDYCEDYIMNAIKTNILGLENLLYLSNEYKVKHFLQISTDKVCYPSNIMGATKYIGEGLCREWNKIMNSVSVIRLGNVLNSRGSLLPTIKKQIKNNNIVYITDKRMYRYLITMEELYNFLNIIFEHMEGGEIFIPKLKEYNIFEYIKDYLDKIKSSVEIQEIGIRKGEKLKELLYTEEEKTKLIIKKDYYLINMEE